MGEVLIKCITKYSVPVEKIQQTTRSQNTVADGSVNAGRRSVPDKMTAPAEQSAGTIKPGDHS